MTTMKAMVPDVDHKVEVGLQQAVEHNRWGTLLLEADATGLRTGCDHHHHVFYDDDL